MMMATGFVMTLSLSIRRDDEIEQHVDDVANLIRWEELGEKVRPRRPEGSGEALSRAPGGTSR